MKESILLGLLACFLGACQGDRQEVRMVARPDTAVKNASYVSNREPLLPQSFIKLPVGDVQPEGWLRKYLLLQREGLTGRLGEISAWLDKEDNAWLMSGGSHGWEEVPYWLKGYGNLAYLLEDSAMMAEAKVWLDAAMESQRPDGNFGPVIVKDGKQDLWANMVMLWCLQSYYEHSHDPRVIELMTNYFKWQMTVPDDRFLEDYWENSRGGDNLYSVLWLYNRTGDAFLLELAEKIHRNTADWTQKSWLPNWHNVNIAQCFREPATYYLLSHDSAHLEATYHTHELVRRVFGQVPGGMFGADENARLAYIDPRQGTETCGFVEQMASDELLLCLTGDPMWAEHCENVAFNSYPAAVMPDFKALRYITSPNHVVSDSKNHRPGIDNGGPFLAMNPFSSRCCQHNHAQGWPYYVEHLVLATPDNGAGVALYGACTATVKVGDEGTPVRLTERTHYPFEERVEFALSAPEPVSFPLYLRIPSWCADASLQVNGKRVNASLTPGMYARIEREWHDGDRVTLDLPMALSVTRWAINQNSASVNYGPLTFSLDIRERYVEVDSKETAIWDSKWQDGADAEAWPAYEIYPDSPWNYALVLDADDPLKHLNVVKRSWPADDFPFTQAAAPVVIEAKGRRVPGWGIDEYGLADVLPDEAAVKSPQVESILLVPMGSARLRISAFPVAE